MTSTKSDPQHEPGAPGRISLEQRELQAQIAAGAPVNAIVEGVARIRIESYVPVVCVAIHDGHVLRPELAGRCRLTEAERRYEEDLHTGDLIQAMPITVVALDSRYEYDLNRPVSQCVYDEAWGKKVWRGRVPAVEAQRSREKHRRFYDALDALAREIEQRFGGCLIIDVHTYNHHRKGPSPPTFNIGTSQVDLQRWDPVLRRLERALAGVDLPNIEPRVARDEVFQGRGYLAAHSAARYEKTLVIPLEIAKVFMEEKTGELFPLVFEKLRLDLKHTFSNVAAFFTRRHTRRKARRAHMLPTTIDPAVVEIDARLHSLARNVNTLLYINPVNIPAERRRFLARRGEELPSFRYRQLDIDPYSFREALYHLPISGIRDPEIQALYRDVVDMLATRIDLVTTLGSDSFLYNSLRYYGEPSAQDLANARFLLHAPEIPDEEEGLPTCDPSAAREFFQQRAAAWDLPVRVELSDRLAAKAMFHPGRGKLLVNRSDIFSNRELEALSHHEMGLHLVTYLNARAQPLKVLRLGLPGNSEAQEGLAVLCEYLSGNLTWSRVRTLAHRVIAVHLMTRYNDFRRTFGVLRTEHGVEPKNAFNLCVRVHRGGGFTKDYLYLEGLRKVLGIYQERSLDPLYAGKVGVAQMSLIEELFERKFVKPPVYRPPCFAEPRPSGPLIDYLLAGIR